MHRVDTSGNVANHFDDGDPLVPRLPTQVDAAILNAFQEELANAIEAMGVTLIKGTNNQLATLIANFVTKTTAQTITGIKTFHQAGNLANVVVQSDASAQAALSVSQGGSGQAISVTNTGSSNAVLIQAAAGNALYAASTGGTAVTFESGSNTDHATIEVKGGAKQSNGAIAATVAMSKTLVQENTPKAWATMACNAGAASITAGFNIASVAVVGTDLVVTLASALAGTGCVVATSGSNVSSIILQAFVSGATVTIKGYNAAGAGAGIDFSAAGNYTLQFVAFGAQ